jgi:hypothetical protein
MVKMENFQENLNKVPLETLFIFAKLLIFFPPDDKKYHTFFTNLEALEQPKTCYFGRFVGLMVNLLERSEPL